MKVTYYIVEDIEGVRFVRKGTYNVEKRRWEYIERLAKDQPKLTSDRLNIKANNLAPISYTEISEQEYNKELE